VTDRLGLKDMARVFISIADINDNAPQVENDATTFYMDFNCEPGTRLGQVLAQDRDSGRNGEIVYRIVGSTLNDTKKHFSVDAEGWIITSIVPRKSAFTTLYLAVADRGWPSQITMATVNIVQVEPSENDTASASLSSAASKNSVSSSTRSEHARINGILILIGLLAVCCAAILVLSYQLWKARRSLRSNLSQAPGSACQYQYHDYSYNKVISGFRALRQARAPVAGHEPATQQKADLGANWLATVPPTPREFND
ncbi:protein dachsous, partial [Plakobranchus ocellatus]